MNDISLAEDVVARQASVPTDGITWHIDDVPWTPLTGLFIKKAGYKTVIDADSSGNAYSIELTTVGPGGFSPTHVEPHAHVFYVLSGVGEVTVGEEVKEVRPGSVSPIAAGDPHSFRNTGSESLEMLVIYHPPRKRGKRVRRANARIHEVTRKTNGVLAIELRPMDGEEFPRYEAGAHIDLHLPDGMVRSYSLCGHAGSTGRYLIGVLNDRNSRGGSRYIHEHLRAGMELSISEPRNNFRLDRSAAHSVFVAGGIGITPILCMLLQLRELGQSAELLYAARTREEAAFAPELVALGVPITWHFDDESDGPPDLCAFIASKAPDAHYYACGPAPMLAAFEAACVDLRRVHVHVERFSANSTQALAKDDPDYTVSLRRSGVTLKVPSGKTLLQTLLDAGIQKEHSCAQGICGACRTKVLEGVPEHRDAVLSPSERAENNVMMVCVSGCKNGSLVLDA